MPDDDFLELDDKKGGEGEQLLLGKFKTPEDLAKSYTELERELTSKSQALAEKERLLQQQQQLPVIQQPVVEDEDSNFFESPTKSIEKVVGKMMSPLLDSQYYQQKEAYRTGNADFSKFEAEIDQIVTNMPHLKTQPNIVGQLYKMVRGLHFDEKEYETRITEKVRAELAGKVEGSLEGGGAVGTGTKKEKAITLTKDEMRVARRFNPGLTAEEAYKKYADKKSKYGGVE